MNKLHQKVSTDRMSLREFSELTEKQINSIVAASQGLNTLKTQFTFEGDEYCFFQRNIIIHVDKLNEHSYCLHETIEFSMCLPLTVVPFLLPLLSAVKKTITHGTYIKKICEKKYVQQKDKKDIINRIEMLNALCEDLLLQERFAVQKARFREKNLKNRGLIHEVKLL